MILAIYIAHENTHINAKATLPYTPPAWATKPIHLWKPHLAPNVSKG
jgi:hypothetical protein